MIAGLKLWHAIMNSNHHTNDVEAVLGGRNTRLTKIASLAEKWSIRTSALGFWVADTWVPAREPWYIVRKILISHIKREDMHALSTRRPESFGGLKECNDKSHKGLLKELTPWDQCLLMKTLDRFDPNQGQECPYRNGELRVLVWMFRANVVPHTLGMP